METWGFHNQPSRTFTNNLQGSFFDLPESKVCLRLLPNTCLASNSREILKQKFLTIQASDKAKKQNTFNGEMFFYTPYWEPVTWIILSCNSPLLPTRRLRKSSINTFRQFSLWCVTKLRSEDYVVKKRKWIFICAVIATVITCFHSNMWYFAQTFKISKHSF